MPRLADGYAIDDGVLMGAHYWLLLAATGCYWLTPKAFAQGT